jgi:hypothetical protein
MHKFCISFRLLKSQNLLDNQACLISIGIASRILCLPISPTLGKEEQFKIIGEMFK